MGNFRLEVGGALCFGSKAACGGSEPSKEARSFIKAIGFVGLDVADPGNNFGAIFVSEITIGKVMEVLSETGIVDFKDELAHMPSAIKRSGILPFDSAGCAADASSEEASAIPKSCKCCNYQLAAHSPLSKSYQLCCVVTAPLRCAGYAFMTYSPAMDNSLKLSSGEALDIPVGLSISGNLRILDKIDVLLKAEVSTTRFFVDASMAELDIGGFLQLGAHLDDGNKAVGRPVFQMDYKIGSAYTRISGAFSIPLLYSHGAIAVDLNDAGFAFSTTLTLFGGLLEASADISWDWNFDAVQILVYVDAPLGFLSVSGTGGANTPAIAMWNSTARDFKIDAHISTMFGFDLQVKLGIVGKNEQMRLGPWSGEICSNGLDAYCRTLGEGAWYGSVQTSIFHGLFEGTVEAAYWPHAVYHCMYMSEMNCPERWAQADGRRRLHHRIWRWQMR